MDFKIPTKSSNHGFGYVTFNIRYVTFKGNVVCVRFVFDRGGTDVEDETGDTTETQNWFQ